MFLSNFVKNFELLDFKPYSVQFKNMIKIIQNYNLNFFIEINNIELKKIIKK